MEFCVYCRESMKEEKDFCIECGEQLETGATFCVGCGTNQTQQHVQPNEQQSLTLTPLVQKGPPITSKTVTQAQVEAPPKKPLSRKSKLLIGIGATIVVLVMGVNYFVQQYFDPQKQVTKMHEAFNKEDAKTFYSYFEIPENTKGTEEQFYDWIADEDWGDIRQEMLEQLQKEEAGISADPIEIMYEDALRITKEDVLFGLFEKTVFKIKPLEVSIEMPFAGTEVTLAEKTVTSTEEEVTVGKFIPGYYSYEYNFEGPYMPFKGTGEVLIASFSDHQVVEELEMEYSSVNLYSNYEDAIVYINDKSTKKTVAEIDTLRPVQFSDDMKIHLVAKNSEGKEIVSSSHALNTDYIEFEFEEDIKLALEENVSEFYELFRSDYKRAIDYIDFSYVSEYFPENEKITKDYKTFVEDHQDISGYRYNFISNIVTDVKIISDTEIELYSKETFDFYSNEDGEVSYVREKCYKIHHENGIFKIKEIKDLNTKKTKN